MKQLSDTEKLIILVDFIISRMQDDGWAERKPAVFSYICREFRKLGLVRS